MKNIVEKTGCDLPTIIKLCAYIDAHNEGALPVPRTYTYEALVRYVYGSDGLRKAMSSDAAAHFGLSSTSTIDKALGLLIPHLRWLVSRDKRMVIFDADGTLTPQRNGSCGGFIYRLLPGVEDACEALHRLGVTLGIASNQSSKRQREVIEAQLYYTGGCLGIHPEMVYWITGDLKSLQKPSGHMLAVLRQHAGVTAADTLMVGDQETDRQAAEDAGTDFVLAADFFAPWRFEVE